MKNIYKIMGLLLFVCSSIYAVNLTIYNNYDNEITVQLYRGNAVADVIPANQVDEADEMDVADSITIEDIAPGNYVARVVVHDYLDGQDAVYHEFITVTNNTDAHVELGASQG